MHELAGDEVRAGVVSQAAGVAVAQGGHDLVVPTEQSDNAPQVRHWEPLVLLDQAGAEASGELRARPGP
ncbi:MAG TPA: hypothetical protein VGN26_03090 [Armatimonadota bacterium]|jgi:hypothetical protein